MKSKVILLTIAVLALFSAANAQKINESLRKELLTLEAEDQAKRNECLKGKAEEQMNCFIKTVEPIDVKNTRRLEEIFAEFGFPTVELVGKDGFEAFMLLLQHSNSNGLRVWSLKPIKRAFKRREVAPDDYALFVDRLLSHQGKPQIYGTQFSTTKDGKMAMDAVRDAKNLDKRRKKIGLSPIAEYVKGLKEIYNLEVILPAELK